MTKAVHKEVMGIFRGFSSENLIKTCDPDTFDGSDPDKLFAFTGDNSLPNLQISNLTS